MNPQNRKNVFELFGFDFMIDEDLRVWLIEVNTNPYLGTPSAHMRNLMPELIDDMLALVVDPILEPKLRPRADKENGFNLLYRKESEEGPAFNKRRPYTLDLCYPVPELKPLIGKVPNDHLKRLRKQQFNQQKTREAASFVEKVNSKSSPSKEISTARGGQTINTTLENDPE